MRIKRSTFDLWKKRLVMFLCACVAFAVLYVYFATTLFTITTYELVGVPEIYKDTVTRNLREIESHTILKFIPGNRVLSYHSSLIKKSVVETIPSTMSISLRPKGLHTMKVVVVEYQPFFRIDDTHGITKDGVIYTEFKDISTLRTITLATSSPRIETNNDGIISVSVAGVDAAKLSSIASLVDKINSIVFTIKRIDVDAYGDISLFDERDMSKIMFSGTQEGEKVWSNLVSAIDTDPLKSKLANNKDKLEYLDARFGNKVFYKFTNDSKTAIIQSHATTSQATSSISH